LGRPGAVLVDGEIVGTWRARKTGAAVAVAVETWTSMAKEVHGSIGEQAERLAAFRHLPLKSLEING
jgi:hypothetical protein